MSDLLISSIQRHCISHRLTLSLAESCTGGHMAARLTKMAGCSAYFLGGVVAYSNTIKQKVLAVEAHLLEEHGAVSAPVVGQMARGVLSLTGSDYALAVTGVAGPEGGSDKLPVGTIWAALASKQKQAMIWHFHLDGTRQEIIEQAAEAIFSRFWNWIQ